MLALPYPMGVDRGAELLSRGDPQAVCEANRRRDRAGRPGAMILQYPGRTLAQHRTEVAP